MQALSRRLYYLDLRAPGINNKYAVYFKWLEIELKKIVLLSKVYMSVNKNERFRTKCFCQDGYLIPLLFVVVFVFFSSNSKHFTVRFGEGTQFEALLRQAHGYTLMCKKKPNLSLN